MKNKVLGGEDDLSAALSCPFRVPLVLHPRFEQTTEKNGDRNNRCGRISAHQRFTVSLQPRPDSDRSGAVKTPTLMSQTAENPISWQRTNNDTNHSFLTNTGRICTDLQARRL